MPLGRFWKTAAAFKIITRPKTVVAQQTESTYKIKATTKEPMTVKQLSITQYCNEKTWSVEVYGELNHVVASGIRDEETARTIVNAVNSFEDLKAALLDMLENGDARSRQMSRAALRKAGVTV